MWAAHPWVRMCRTSYGRSHRQPNAERSAMSTVEKVAQSRGTAIVKVVFASLVGTAVEWYDFFLYGSAAALVFGSQFFPKSDPVTGTLLAFGTYALGFVARPLGGIVFG